MGKNSGTTSGLGGFMSGASIRFSKLKNGAGGVDAWRDQLGKVKLGEMGRSRPRTTGMAIPKLNSIHQGLVVSMHEYGAFVTIGKGDVYKDALVHVSNVTGVTRYETAEEAGLGLGMTVWVKCSEVREEELKYSLDMRFVDQRNGKDLDPYQARGVPPDNFFEPHWSKKRAKVLEPEEDEPPAPQESSAASSKEAPGKKKSKKRKKDKSDDSDEEEDDDDLGEVEEARAKVSKKLEKARKKLEKAKKKAEKLKKKLKKNKSSSSSDSE